MEAVNSIGDSLDWEGEAIKRQATIDDAVIAGVEIPDREAEDVSEEMQKTLVAGDVIHNNNYYSADGQTATGPATTAQATAPAVAPTVNRATKEDIENFIKRKVAEKVAAKLAAAKQTAAPAAEPWYKRWAPAIVGGVLALGGAGTAVVVSQTESTPAAVAPAATDTKYDFEISSEPGKGFVTE